MRKKDSSTKDRATAYALAVVSEEIPAGPFVRGACQRHLNDLERAGERGFYYDEHEAAEGIAFFEEILHLAGGQWEGKPFLLLPWESFIISSLYGWKRKSDDRRRFRVLYVETPKGSGKSPIAAGIGLKGLCADKEPRAAIFAAATKRDQAMILFRDAVAFVEQSPILQQRLVMSGLGEKCWNLSHLESGSFFRVVSAEKKGLSGERPHVALLDEIHEHPDGTIIEQLRAGFKTRTQPIMFLITNSGSDTTSVCWEYHEMGAKIAQEQVQNDEFFAYICSLDDDDLVDDHYLDDETLWPKVNPSLEYGLPGYDYIRSQVLEARGMPSKMATVKRLCFCQWTAAENPAIGPEVWMACQDKDYPVDILLGRRAWGGLDLSAVLDLTAFALMFEPSTDDSLWRLKVWYWLPGVGLVKKADQDHVPYIAWRDAKYIRAIPRKTIEYEFVIKDIVELCGTYNVQKIAFDRWNKKTFDKELLRLGVNLPEVVEFGQGFQSMAPAIKIFETKFTEATMRHDGNPCLTWNASNVVAIEDAADNKKYVKPSSGGRIDGIIAAVMACGILEEGAVGSIYDGKTKEEIKEMMAL
jgi:phage terminase large subunit-like protein